MGVYLYLNGYQPRTKQRAMELDYALLKNIQNPSIDGVFILVNGAYNTQVGKLLPTSVLRKVQFVSDADWPHEQPLTYAHFIDTLRDSKPSESNIKIICNSDIFFSQKSIDLLIEHLGLDMCFALSRWERLDRQWRMHPNPHWSQDSWCFRTVPYESIQKRCEFPIGRRGCDNRFAAELQRSGAFTVFNPCREIRSYHVHPSQQRWESGMTSMKVDPPYRFVFPCSLDS
jgi:hypothetical protein